MSVMLKEYFPMNITLVKKSQKAEYVMFSRSAGFGLVFCYLFVAIRYFEQSSYSIFICTDLVVINIRLFVTFEYD